MTTDPYHVPRPCARCGKDVGEFGTLYACTRTRCPQHNQPVCVRCTERSYIKKHVLEYREPLWQRVPNWVWSLLILLALTGVLFLVLIAVGAGSGIKARLAVSAFFFFLGFALDCVFGWGFGFGLGWGWSGYFSRVGASDLTGVDFFPPENRQTPESPYSRAPLRCCRTCGFETRKT